jgi:hypothetical protein
MVGTTAVPLQLMERRYLFLLVIAGLALLRLCHVRLLWADEDYHIAASIDLLHGKLPYRDFWYDKPPLCAVYYLLIGGFAGWPLRLLDAGYVLLGCWLVYRVTRTCWDVAEARLASLLFAFFMTFYLPSTVIPFAADALMIVPHIAAIYCALLRKPFWAGLWAGMAFLFNAKGVFVLLVCILWMLPQCTVIATGFALPLAAGLITAFATGAWAGYYEQVWRWGLIYAEQSPVTNPLTLGLKRTADWLGFQGALTAGAICAFLRFTRDERWKFGVWIGLSFGAACLGTRFAPHYFLQLLPPMVIVAARGIILALREFRKPVPPVLVALLLLVPLIRFGPRYLSLALEDIRGEEPHWSDIALDLDSQRVAARVNSLKRSGNTLFVWGYRPDIYVYTRLVSDGRFWDSQPLTGVPADRHLKVATAIYSGPAAANRRELTRSQPTFIVDGLGLLNPALSPGVYPELRSWLAHYKLVARTSLSLIYRRYR